MSNFLDRWFMSPSILAELEQCKEQFELRRDKLIAERNFADATENLTRRAEDQALQREFNAAIAAIQEKHRVQGE